MAAVDTARDDVRADRPAASTGAAVVGPARWIELAQTIQRLAGARALGEVVDVIRQSARRLIGSDGVAFILREDGFCHYVAEDAAAPLWAGQRFPLATCVSGWAMEHGRTAVIPDVYADERVPKDAYLPTFVKSMVMAPVAGGPNEKAVAAIGAYWAERRDPEPDEIAILEALARSSATAIANTQLFTSLLASDALQRAIIESTPECIKIVAEDGRLLQMNSAGLSMIEAADEASVLEANTFDLIAPEHRVRWGQMHKRVCAGDHLDWEFDIIGLGGTRRRMETHAVPLQLPDGTVAQLAVTRDVTRRKTAEEALRLERDRSRAVLDNLGDGYVLVDRDFRVLEINPAGLAIEQRPASEIVGKTFWEAWPGVEEGEAGRMWKEAMTERAPRSLEHRYVWPNGRSAWLEIRAFPADSGLAFFFRDVGDRRAAEAMLAEREAHLAAIFAQAAAGMSEADATGRFVRVNDRMCEITGRSREELLSLRMHDITHPDDLPGNAPLFDRAITAGVPFEIEKRYVRPNGSLVWVHNSVTTLREANGELRNTVCVTIDVSGRKAAEQALRESEGRFREIADAAPALIWISDTTKACTWFNRPWLEFTGRTMEEEAGYGWAEGVHPDDFDRCVATYNEAFDKREQFRMDYRLRRHDGEYRVFDDAGVPRIAEDGTFLGYIGACTDVTEARHAEQVVRELNETLERRVAERTAELSESQRRFQGIFNSALQFMALLTPDGTVVEVNETALAWSQIEPAEIVGKPFWLAAPMRENPTLQEAIESGVRRAAGGETVRQEHEMRGAGDIRATVDFSLKPVPGESGEPIWLVAEGRDITELKQAQEALRQSQKMEAMGQLTGGVAHDFNNLLTPIIGSLDMLTRRGVGNERERRLIDGGLQSAERAKTLVQRLLAFARRQPLQPTAVDIKRLVGGMAELVASTSGPSIDVRVELPDDLPPAVADANQLEMAILNLAVNARDAMPDGGVLTISATSESVRSGHRSKLRQGHYVRLSVSDTGTGMDEATLSRAIEPFFSTKGIGKGTGLGLSMVHGLALQLNGGLTITSRPGEGTMIDLWLPISSVTAESGDEALQVSPAPQAVGKALLVDDEDLVRMSTADMLMDLGYEVVEAISAEEALRLVRQGLAPDLLVTDHLMPGMSGAELARDLRARTPDLPVLIVSGYAEAEGVASDLPRLTKPFRNAELAASLAALMPASAA